MKKPTLRIILCMTSLLWVACGETTVNSDEGNYRNYITDSLSAEVPFSRSDPAYFAMDGSGTRICLLEKDSMKLFMFDPAGKTFSAGFHLPFAPEKQVTYSVVRPGEIYVMLMPRTIVQLNGSGQVTKKWQVDSPIRNFNTHYVLWGMNECPLIADSSFFYVLYAPRTDLRQDSSKTRLFSSPVLLQIDRDSGKLAGSLFSFPESYLHQYYEVLFPSYTRGAGNSLVASFETEDSVTVCRLPGKGYKRMEMKSRYYTPKSPFAWNGKEEYYAYKERYAVENAGYYSLHYDRFRHQYYRVCLHKGRYRNADGTITTRLEPSWSLVIADSAFQTRREVFFPGSAYDYRDLLITPGGVLISKNNPYGKRFQKNHLNYDVFRF
jgi:hypothetical protein